MKINYIAKVTALSLALCLFAPVSAFARPGEWGLGFDKPGERPEGNETAEYLKQFDAYFIGADDKSLYLTFDSGYENGYTAKILDTLKAENVPAAFFLVSGYYKDAPELVKRMVDEGHIVGNHTVHHPDMRGITDRAAFEKELRPVEETFKSLTGKELPRYYRPPMGHYSELNLKTARDLGYKTIFWSTAYKDYDNNDQPSWGDAFAKLMPRVHPGAVILLHSTSKTNAAILGDFIKRCKDMGYEFKSLDELIKSN